jgi:hypothetical protein
MQIDIAGEKAARLAEGDMGLERLIEILRGDAV